MKLGEIDMIFTSPFSYKTQPLKELNYWKNVTVNSEGALERMEQPKPYFVMQGDRYVFSDRFVSPIDADDFARAMAKWCPDTDFTVCRMDRRFRGEAEVKVTSRFVS